MKIPSKKLISILFFILSIFCFIRLLRILINTTPSAQQPPLSPLLSSIFHPNNTSIEHIPHVSHKVVRHAHSASEQNLSPKEYRLLSNLILKRAPCNLLIFGVTSQLLNLSKLNVGGINAFLEDNAEKPENPKPNTDAVQVYKVSYHHKASEAFELLRHAREHPACRAEVKLYKSRCNLALFQLQKEIHSKIWNVIVVDGPRGDQPEAPGRMQAIYTVGMLARAGNLTDVFVHDVNRMIEKWYSWEFLCQENLLSSKGNLWHFQLKGGFSSASFCQATVHS